MAFQQLSSVYDAGGFPGEPMRGRKATADDAEQERASGGRLEVLEACWTRDVKRFKAAISEALDHVKKCEEVEEDEDRDDGCDDDDVAELPELPEQETSESKSCEDEDEDEDKLDNEAKDESKEEDKNERTMRKRLLRVIAANADDRGNTALHVATYRGATKIVRYLLTELQGVKGIVDLRTHQQMTALHYACKRNRDNIALRLLSAGADATARDLNGNTCLHFAVEGNSMDVVKRFIHEGLPVDMSNAGGITPLLVAVRDGHKSLALLLASAGADMCSRNTMGKTPLAVAEGSGWGEDLRRAGARPDRPAPPSIVHKTDHSTILRWAATAGRSAPVLHYKVQVRRIDRLHPDAPWVTAGDELTQLRFVFDTCGPHCSSFSRTPTPEDLMPSEVYAVRVSAYSIVGWSEPSERSQYFVTAPAAPARPEPPVVVQTTNTSVTVRWRHPNDNGGPILRSELQWSVDHTPYAAWSSVPSELKTRASLADPGEEAESVPSSDESRTSEDEPDEPASIADATHGVSEYIFHGLAPHAFYNFRVRCHNLVGWSYYSFPSPKFCPASAPTRARAPIFDVGCPPALRAALAGAGRAQEVRFLAVHRASEDRVAFQALQARARSDVLVRQEQEAAAVLLQAFWRCRRAVRKLAQFKIDKVERRVFLVEYGLEAEFLAEWRVHLMRFVLQSRQQKRQQQAHRDARHKRKLQRRVRRERRQLIRVQRREKPKTKEATHASNSYMYNS